MRATKASSQYKILNGYKLVLRRKLGVFYHVALVSNYGTGLEKTLMHSEKYHNKQNAKRAQERISELTGVEVA